MRVRITAAVGLCQLVLLTVGRAAAAAAAAATTLAHNDVEFQVNDWKVQSIVRNVDLGSVAHLTDTHVIRAPFEEQNEEPQREEDVRSYFFALSSREAEHVTGLEATARYGPGVLSQQRALLKVKEHGPRSFGSSVDTFAPRLYSVRLPLHFFQRGEGEERLADVTITVTGLLTHASEPLPKSIGQTESQYMLWRGSAAPVTPYGAGSGRVKVKASHATILSYSTEPALTSEQMVKSGSIITFGPYPDGLPALGSSYDDKTKPSEAQVHYLHNSPVLTIVEAKRQARISHWRNRLTIEDQFWLRNDGAQLKGHFSRVQHQLSTLVQRTKTHALTNVVMHLPPGADDAYFTDESGNVSTSHFRHTPSSRSHISTPAHLLSELRASILDFRPRYPLLGGWNYTCSVGWSVKLSDGWLKPASSKKFAEVGGSTHQRRFSVNVPFLSAVKDVAIDDATLRIVLPEGAKDIAFTAPFAIDVQRERSWSFLDTLGKPVLLLRKQKCSERCGAMLEIDYTLTVHDQYRKVIVAVLTVVLLSSIVRWSTHIDLSLK